MADKTFGVKVSEELQEKVQNMISGSNLTAKEWFEKAIALVEVNELKEGASDYTQDLNELEAHTTRIFDLVANMLKRANYLKENETKGLLEKLENRDTIITEYQEKCKESQAYAQIIEEQAVIAQRDSEMLVEKLEETRLTNINNQALIAEYKEKIDSMSGLVAKYQGFAEENETLKQDFVKEKELLQHKIKEIADQLSQQKDEIKTYQQTLESLKEAHVLEIGRLEEKKAYEKDREMRNLEKEQQQQLAAIQKEHNGELKAFYDEKDRIRKEYEAKIEMLQKELNESEKKRETEKSDGIVKPESK
mgnify:FL=1